MQEGLRVLFRHISEADRYLRIQIKDAIFRDLRPDEILVELRNSPNSELLVLQKVNSLTSVSREDIVDAEPY